MYTTNSYENYKQIGICQFQYWNAIALFHRDAQAANGWKFRGYVPVSISPESAGKPRDARGKRERVRYDGYGRSNVKR